MRVALAGLRSAPGVPIGVTERETSESHTRGARPKVL